MSAPPVKVDMDNVKQAVKSALPPGHHAIVIVYGEPNEEGETEVDYIASGHYQDKIFVLAGLLNSLISRESTRICNQRKKR